MIDEFQLRKFNSPAGEPHVYVVHGQEFPAAFNTSSATIAEVTYEGGGWAALTEAISIACEIPARCHLQALYERLEDLSSEKHPLILVIRGADKLLTDIGTELLVMMSHWEAFVRHARGASSMYLVLDIGQQPRPA